MMRIHILVITLTVFVLGASKNAYALCSSPTGKQGALAFITSEYKFCNTSDTWVSFITGNLTTCSGKTSWEYDTGESAYKFCDGSNSRKIICVAGGGGGTCPDGSAGGDLSLYKEYTRSEFNFGETLAISGDLIAVGAWGASVSGNSAAGKAFIYDMTDDSVITIDNPAPAFTDRFGISVDVSGTNVLVGAYTDDPGGVSDAGTSYLFNATNGSLIRTINNPQPASSDGFGRAVALEGTTAVISAYRDDSDGAGGNDQAGRVFVFDTSDGSLVTTLDNPNPNTNDRFGESVSISGATVVVGAHQDSPGGVSTAGTAYLFDATDGSLIATLNNPDPQANDNFGLSVAVDGTRAVIGKAGKAYVFDTTDGSLISNITYSQAGESHQVSIYGTTVVAGNEVFDATGGSLIGSVETTYYASAHGVDIIDGYAVLGGGYNGSDYSIYVFTTGHCSSCSISANTGVSSGYTVLARPAGIGFGASVDVDDTTAIISAHNNGSGTGDVYLIDTTTGNLLYTLSNPSSQSFDYYGVGVAVEGAYAVVGESRAAVSGAGEVYVFDTGTGNLLRTITNPSAGTDDAFAHSVDISGTSIIVGARLDESDGESGTSNAGRAYVFDATDGSLISTLNNPSPNVDGYFGNSVSISGNIAIVGAYKDEADGGTGTADAGRAYVFDVTDGSLISTLNNPDPQTNDEFGLSVAIYGTTAVVGATQEDVYVFDTETGNITTTIVNTNGNALGYFGSQVAIKGGIIAIGEEGEFSGGFSAAGVIHIYKSDGTYITTIGNPEPAVSDNMGRGGNDFNAVAISGMTVVGGVPGDDTDGSNYGRAYAFTLTPSGNFSGPITEVIINHPDPVLDDHFAAAVAVSGTTAIIGAPDKKVSSGGQQEDAGEAYIVDVTDGTTLYTLQAPSDINDLNNFGFSVAISGDYIVVGEPDGDVDVTNSGSAHVYSASDGSFLRTLNNPSPSGFPQTNFGTGVSVSGTLAAVGAPYDSVNTDRVYIYDVTDGSVVTTISSPATGKKFGWSVSMSGTTVVVGAFNGGASNEGIAYVYDATDGSLISTLNNPNATLDDRFGYSVAVSGTTAVVGAYREDPSGGGGDDGIAYVFDTTDGSLLYTLDNPDLTASDYFGYSVSISGDMAIVGAYQDDPNSTNNAGLAYLFDVTDGTLIATLDNPSGIVADDQFAYAVAISGNVALVGARQDDPAGGDGNDGAAYAFFATECQRVQPTGGDACSSSGSCSKTGAIEVIGGKFVVCNGSVWEVFAE